MDQKDLENVYARGEIESAIISLFKETEDYFVSIPLGMFYERIHGWTAEENIIHLNRSTHPVVLGLSTPRFVFWLFGKHSGKSRNYSEVREAYLGKLKPGSGSGFFSPIAFNVNSGIEEEKYKLIIEWSDLSKGLLKHLPNWTEEDLDACCVPHPILIRITMRELLLFTLYHVTHHVDRLRSKLML